MRPAVRGRKNGRKTIGPEGVRNKSKRGKKMNWRIKERVLWPWRTFSVETY